MNPPRQPWPSGGPAPVVGAATDVGRTRSVNEDGYLAQDPAFVVVDGMGGHAAGRAATRAALGAVRELGGRRVRRLEEVTQAVRRAAEAVSQIPSNAVHRPGATIAGAVLADLEQGPTWLVLNIGDARVYLLREGLLTQITRDHSQVQELIEARRLTRAEARTDFRRNIVTRALGGGIEDDGVPDLHAVPAGVGDRLLVCSDGLSDELDDEELASVLGAGLAPQRTAEMLVAASLEAGGHDNTTAIVVDLLLDAVPAMKGPSQEAR